MHFVYRYLSLFSTFPLVVMQPTMCHIHSDVYFFRILSYNFLCHLYAILHEFPIESHNLKFGKKTHIGHIGFGKAKRDNCIACNNLCKAKIISKNTKKMVEINQNESENKNWDLHNDLRGWKIRRNSIRKQSGLFDFVSR